MDKQRINGKDWIYDAEQGVYRPAEPPESLWSKWGWVASVIVLGLMCWLLDR
jgi:GH18 family chitinase